MLPYFPFHDDVYKPTMGVQALLDNSLIEVDMASYREELALKNALLSEEYEQYFQAQPDTEPMQWETIALLLPCMAQLYPQHFTLRMNEDHWTWHNRLLDEKITFVFGENSSLSLQPLDWLGRQVQEDLLLLDGSGTKGMPLVAGHLCFPNAWCLDDKMGKSFLGIHQPVPLFAQYLGRSTSLLLERLKVGRPVWRVNWSIKGTNRLNHMPRYSFEEENAARTFTVENTGERSYLRLERQTLSRLPLTQGILFTIRTYQAPIATLINNAEHVRRIAGVVRTMPQELLQYKSIASYRDVLLNYFDSALMKQHRD
jgi:hypothetical protein